MNYDKFNNYNEEDYEDPENQIWENGFHRKKSRKKEIFLGVLIIFTIFLAVVLFITNSPNHMGKSTRGHSELEGIVQAQGGSTYYLDPNADGATTDWDCIFADCSYGHFAVINESIRQPTTESSDGIELYSSNVYDFIEMENQNIGSDTVTSINIWVYGYLDESQPFGVGNIWVQIDLGDETSAWQSVITVDDGTTTEWGNYTFTGEWTQTQLNNLELRFNANSSDSGNSDVDAAIVYTAYTEVTTEAGEDSTNPLVDVTYPLNITYDSVVTALNYTASDETALDSCWYSLDSGATNTTVTCGNNVTGLSSSDGSNTWEVWVNDTNNNINSSSVTFYQEPPENSTQRTNFHIWNGTGDKFNHTNQAVRLGFNSSYGGFIELRNQSGAWYKCYVTDGSIQCIGS